VTNLRTGRDKTQLDSAEHNVPKTRS